MLRTSAENVLWLVSESVPAASSENRKQACLVFSSEHTARTPFPRQSLIRAGSENETASFQQFRSTNDEPGHLKANIEQQANCKLPGLEKAQRLELQVARLGGFDVKKRLGTCILCVRR